jgi:hypothetical protein
VGEEAGEEAGAGIVAGQEKKTYTKHRGAMRSSRYFGSISLTWLTYLSSTTLKGLSRRERERWREERGERREERGERREERGERRVERGERREERGERRKERRGERGERKVNSEQREGRERLISEGIE